MTINLEVPKLGVRQQDAVIDDGRADAGAQSGENDNARYSPRSAVVDLAHTCGVGVVKNGHWAAESVTNIFLGVQAGPT